MDARTYTPTPLQLSRVQTAGAGAGWGLTLGLVGSVATALICAQAFGVYVAIFGVESDRLILGLTWTVVFAFYGSIVAGILGMVVGTVAGTLLGAAQQESTAPALAAVLCSVLPVVASISLAFSGDGTLGAPVIPLMLIPGTAGIGLLAGAMFDKKCKQYRGVSPVSERGDVERHQSWPIWSVSTRR